MEDNNTVQAHSQDNVLVDGSGDASAAVNTAGPEVLSLSEINGFLGKNFKDTATALKALKDTQSYVGKRKEDIAKELSTAAPSDTYASKDEVRHLQDELFFSRNPAYAPYAETIQDMRKNGEALADVVKKDGFKNIFEDLTLAAKTRDAKTVLVSNSRVGQVRSKLDEARTLAKNYRTPEANSLAVQAVLESLE